MMKLQRQNVFAWCMLILLIQSAEGWVGGSISRIIIHTDSAPGSTGLPFSQAVQVDSTLYLSGQLGLDPVTGSMVEGGVVEEANQAMVNLGEVLAAAGTDFSKVVKTTVMLADINDFGAVNEVYQSFFIDNYPARAAYQVANLAMGARVEIEAIAVVGDVQTIKV